MKIDFDLEYKIVLLRVEKNEIFGVVCVKMKMVLINFFVKVVLEVEKISNFKINVGGKEDF